MRICRPMVIPKLSLLVGLLSLPPSNCWASELSSEESLWPLIFKFINIAIFVLILYKLGAKKIAGFFRDRRQRAREVIEGASQKEVEAAQLLKEWEEKITRAEEEARRIVQTSLIEGRATKERMLKEAEEEAKRILEQAKATADEEIKKMRGALGKELAAIAASKAETLLREKMDAGQQMRLIEEFLSKIEDIS